MHGIYAVLRRNDCFGSHFRMYWKGESEINLSVIAAFEPLFRFFLRRLTGVGADADIGKRVLCNFGQALQENFLRNKAFLSRQTVGTVVCDAPGNVQLIVHIPQVTDQQIDLFLYGIAAGCKLPAYPI